TRAEAGRAGGAGGAALMSEAIEVGIVGGSGLYEMDGFEGARPLSVDTPFGPPSDAIVTGTLEGRRVGFLPRHARGHRLLATQVNHRGHADALYAPGAGLTPSL